MMANHWKEQQQEAKVSDLMKACRALIDAGKRVDAIKMYRQRTGVDLRRAMSDLALKHW
jgi:hypothetical protein